MSKAFPKLYLAMAAILVAALGSAAAQEDAGSQAANPILSIKPGTKVMLNLDTPLNTATARIEDVVWFTTRDDVKVDGQIAMPRGTPIRGSVRAVKPAVVNGKNQRTEIRIGLEAVPLEDGGSYTVAAEVLKVQGEKPAGGVSASGTASQASQGAMLGGMITRSAKGAGIGAIGAAGVAIVEGMIRSKGPTADVDLPGGSIFEAKLERALHIPNPTLLAKAVPKPATPPTPNIAVASSQPTATAGAPVDIAAGEPERKAEPAAVPTFEPVADARTADSNVETSAKAESADASAAPVTVKAAKLTVDVNLVQVDAVVRDRSGKPMNSLRREDFRILEDGVEQQIQLFSRDQQPLAVALVIDRSGSVAPLMADVQNAAYQALKLLKSGDEVCLFTFAANVEMLEELTKDRQRVANRIGRIQAGGGTAIVDALSEAVRYLDAVAPDSRRAVILISDNAEVRSQATVSSVTQDALESEAVIYSVKVGAPSTGLLGFPGIPGLSRLPGTGPSDPVKTITKETGGEIFDATGGSSITGALTTAVDRLKTRYTLGYAANTHSPDRQAKGGYHRIEVMLVSRFGRPETDYTIHSRSGYYDTQ